MKKLFFATLMFFCTPIFAQEYRVFGTVNTTPPELAENVPVVLLRIDPNITEGSPMMPIMRTATDPQGRFSFENIPHEERFSYQLGTLVGAQRVASEPFVFNEIFERTIDIQVPEMTVNQTEKPPAPAGNYKVSGKVYFSDQRPAALADIVLLRIDPQNTTGKPIMPILRSKTDEMGNYFFEKIPHEIAFTYQIGTLAENQRVGSEPFTFDTGFEKNIEVVIPTIKQGLGEMQLLRNILVVNIMKDSLRVTEIISANNPTGSILDGSQEPLERELPDKAFNVRSFTEGQPEEATVFENGIFRMGLKVLPGDTQILYEYDLPIGFAFSQTFRHHVPTGVKEMELITPIAGELSLYLKGEITPQEERNFNGEIYNTKTVPLLGSVKYVEIHVENIPVIHNISLLLVSIFFIVLVGTLFFFQRHMKGRSEIIPQ